MYAYVNLKLGYTTRRYFSLFNLLISFIYKLLNRLVKIYELLRFLLFHIFDLFSDGGVNILRTPNGIAFKFSGVVLYQLWR